MSMLKKIYIRINSKEKANKSRIFYDDTLGILREGTAVVQVRYVASPAIVVRKTKRALRNGGNESPESRVQGKVVVG